MYKETHFLSVLSELSDELRKFDKVSKITKDELVTLSYLFIGSTYVLLASSHSKWDIPVENSLHPTVQRLVMWNLKNLTREWDMQLIVATHSLEIIQTVRQDAFINLDYLEEVGKIS